MTPPGNAGIIKQDKVTRVDLDIEDFKVIALTKFIIIYYYITQIYLKNTSLLGCCPMVPHE